MTSEEGIKHIICNTVLTDKMISGRFNIDEETVTSIRSKMKKVHGGKV